MSRRRRRPPAATRAPPPLRWRAALAALAMGLAGAAEGAATIRLIGLGPGRAEIVVDGASVRSLRPGQRSPEGIELVEAGRDAALFAVDGAQLRLRLGESNEPAVVLRADARGHFFASVVIDGRETQALVDTGATSLALNAAEARRLGIVIGRGRRVAVHTAAGTVAGHLVRLGVVRLGGIALSDVEAVVHDSADEPPVSLLGMSFLGRLDWQRSGDTLTLRRRRE